MSGCTNIAIPIERAASIRPLTLQTVAYLVSICQTHLPDAYAEGDGVHLLRCPLPSGKLRLIGR